MDLNDIANLIEILGNLAILVGIIFALVQLKQHRTQRRDHAVLEVARSFEDGEFTEAYRLLSVLPSGMTHTEFEKLGERYQAAAIRTAMKFETIGVLAYKGVVPIDAMEDLVGGAALRIWQVTELWLRDLRSKTHPRSFEWFHWLIDRLMERGTAERGPAYECHTDWKPPAI